ncbi:MAG: signal recognition particle receptor subunit alpha, partial [Aeriscardovia aeriphila]|nr:signal recognition particle receptor subunit alpha [Aeriscardovia aeriphila]
MDLTTTLLIILGVIVVVAIIGVVIAKSAHKGAQTGEKPAVEASEATAAAEGEPQDAEHKQEAEAQAEVVAATENKPKAEPQQTAEPQPEAEPAAQPEAARPEAAAQPETAAQPEPEAPVKQEIAKPENSQSRLVRLRSKLAHSANPFGKALFSILSRDHLSEEDWEDVEDTLLLADVGAEASEKIVDELRQDSRAQGTRSAEEVRDMLRERLLDAVGRDTDR